MKKVGTIFGNQVMTRKRVRKNRYGVRFLAHSVAIDTGKRSTYLFRSAKSASFGGSVRGKVFHVA